MSKSLLVVEGKTTNPPMLQIANFSKALVLMTDASAVAAAGCLLQANYHGNLFPIAFYQLYKYSVAHKPITRSAKKSLLPLFYVLRSGIKPEQVQLFKLVRHNHNQAL